MSTEHQIKANRRNSQKSTGPRSPEGKAKTRFNALKSGLHVQSQVIPGEDAAELEALAADYREQFHPDSPETFVLVDSLIAADWQLRRLRKIETQLWQRELSTAADLAEAYSRNPVLDQALRRIQATERSYRQTLNQIRQIRQDEQEAELIQEAEEEGFRRGKRVAEIYDAIRAAESGSFSTGKEAAGHQPDPEDKDKK
jgi:hypothetical protein